MEVTNGTTATWADIQAEATKNGINLFPAGYTLKTLNNNPSPNGADILNSANKIGIVFEKYVSYKIVYNPLTNLSEEAKFSIQYPATYAEESLKDIFAKAKVDTNTNASPALGYVALFLPLNSGKVFAGWTVTGKTEIFKPSEIDNNKRGGQTLQDIRSGSVITAKLDTPPSIPLGNNTSIDFTEIKSSSVGDFFIQNTEITRGQWKAVMRKDNGGDENDPSQWNWYLSNGKNLWTMKNESGDSNNMDLPMTHISWYEAVAFCNLLSINQGIAPYYYLDMSSIGGSSTETDPSKWGTMPVTKNDWKRHTTHPWDNIGEDGNNKVGYRLPTTDQWLVAAKGGDGPNAEYGPFGTYSGTTGTSDNDLKKIGWYTGNAGGKAHNVGELGGDYPVRDMSGNVWEWCWGSTTNTYQGTVIPTKPGRGGGYGANANQVKITNTNDGSPAEYYSRDFGFRIMYKE